EVISIETDEWERGTSLIHGLPRTLRLRVEADTNLLRLAQLIHRLRLMPRHHAYFVHRHLGHRGDRGYRHRQGPRDPKTQRPSTWHVLTLPIAHLITLARWAAD